MFKEFVTTGATYGCRANPNQGLDKEIEEFIDNLEGATPNGVFCTPVAEPVPTHLKAGCEIVYPGMQSPHNTFIVLGRDRPESLASGKGGKGHTKCGMIDLVVGKGAMTTAKRVRMGPIGTLALGGGAGCEMTGEDVMGPNFVNDAARIYISAATDEEVGGIDGYLGLPSSISIDSGGKSAIALKADHTRIVGRETVRIYAGSARNTEGSFLDDGGETNVLGNSLDKARIELVAGNTSRLDDLDDGDLQPVVLGDNLKSYLSALKENLINGYSANREFAQEMGKIFLILINLCVRNGMLVGAGMSISGLIKMINQYLNQWLMTLDTVVDSINNLDELYFRGATSIVSATVFTT